MNDFVLTSKKIKKPLPPYSSVRGDRPDGDTFFFRHHDIWCAMIPHHEDGITPSFLHKLSTAKDQAKVKP